MKNIFYILAFFLISCDDTSQNNIEQKVSKPLLSISKKNAEIVAVKSIYKNETENWEELNSLNSFMSRFSKISPNEALSNALELKGLVESLRDSVTPNVFDIPSFKTRINILNNEVLRLVDLTYISAITAEEVNEQVDKTLASFSTVNSKINTILSQKQFEDDIDIDISFIGIDTTKIDNVSKKTILKLNEDLLLEKKPVKKSRRPKLITKSSIDFKKE